MELSTPENEAIVRSICEAMSAARESGKSTRPDHQLIYDIDYLLMEANSGASFEQDRTDVRFPEHGSGSELRFRKTL